jgi:hypothetical protein
MFLFVCFIYGSQEVILKIKKHFKIVHDEGKYKRLLKLRLAYSQFPQSYFNTFVNKGSSYRRKIAACPKFDVVWLNCSPRRRGVISSFKLFLTAFPCVEQGGGGRHPVV